MPAPSLDIRGTGESWGAYLGSQRIGAVASTYDAACLVAQKWETLLQTRPRKCLCCNQDFMATGKHNRLCAPCKETYA